LLGKIVNENAKENSEYFLEDAFVDDSAKYKVERDAYW